MDDKNNKNLNTDNQSGYSKLNLKTISIFQNDTQTIFIFKKTERLASAIYLITSFLLDNEPVKWKLRDIVTRLLSYSINLSNQGHRSRADTMNNFTATSFEIISLLEVADISGIFSSMNCKIIKFEIEKIIDLVELKERGLGAKFLLPRNFFETAEDYSVVRNKSEQAGVSVSEKDIIRTPNQGADKEVISETNLSRELLSIKDIKRTPLNKGHIVRDKNQRYEVIINLLKKIKEISIKDVSSIISDCSEKTIQRELLSLVDKGVLKKEGERRWSKYSLVS